ncbi:putative reverse transcriptase domain-containing protein [Tanacetum coccineum]
MVGTRGSTPEFLGPAFEAAVQRAVDALLPGLTTQLTNEIRQNDGGGSGDQPPTIQLWLKGLGKLRKPRSFSSATTPVDAENWIAHIEKIFEVLGCADEFKARLASYKLEGDALNWWKAFKQAKGGETYVATLSWKDFRDIFFLQYFPRSEQQKYEREYHTIRQRNGETSGEFMKRFLRLAGFMGNKAGPQEKQAKHFKWALCDWILDGIVNTEFTNVAQVANADRNMEILRERSSQNNKRNRDGDRIRPTAQDSNQRGYDQKGYDSRSYDRKGGNSNQKSWQNRGQQYNSSSGFSGQKRYPDYASFLPCDICGKLHLGKACHRVTGACFTCGATHSVVSVSFTKHISISPTQLNYKLSISTPMKSLVIITHEYQNCPLRFDDKIRSANLFPLDMNDFDIILFSLFCAWMVDLKFAPLSFVFNNVSSLVIWITLNSSTYFKF